MRTISTNVFNYDELSDEAKEETLRANEYEFAEGGQPA